MLERTATVELNLCADMHNDDEEEEEEDVCILKAPKEHHLSNKGSRKSQS